MEQTNEARSLRLTAAAQIAPAAGAEEDESEGSTKTLSVAVATLTLTQNILGAGVLALPYALSCAGLGGGLALIALIYVLSALSMAILPMLCNALGIFSYKEAALPTLGVKVAVASEVWVLCYSLGVVVSYAILLGDTLHDLAVHFGAGDWASERLFMALPVVCFCWPLSCAPSLGVLKYTSVLGLASILYTMVAVAKRYGDGSYDNDETNHPAMFNAKTFGKCFPILVTAFGAHFNIPNLYKEVAPMAGHGDVDEDRRGFKRMFMVIVNALTISSVIYGSIGLLGYLTFGSNIQSDFSKNFRTDDPLIIGVRFAMAVALICTFPLIMVASRASLIKLTGWEATPRVQIPVATVLTALCLLIALVCGNVSTALAYNGAVFGTPVCFVLPVLMYMNLPRPQQEWLWRVFSASCVVIGVLFGILGVTITTLGIVEGN